MFRRFLVLPFACLMAFVISMPLGAQQAPAAAQPADAAAKPAEAAPAAKPAEKVKLMIYDGEKAKLQLYGFIKLDAVYNTTGVAHEAGPMAVDNPAGLLPVQKNKGSFTMEGRNTRLGFNFTMPEALGAKLTGVIEVDFWGMMPVHGAASNQSMIRMRHAYAKLVWPTETSLLVGQFWSAAMVYEVMPNMATFIPMGKCGLLFAREQQVTLGQKVGDKVFNVSLDLSAARVQAGNDTVGAIFPGPNGLQADERGAGEASCIPGFRGKLAFRSAPIDGLSVIAGTTGFYQKEKQPCAAWDHDGDSLFDTDKDGKNADSTDTANIVTRTDMVNSYGFLGFLSVMYQMVGVSGHAFYGSNMDSFLSIAGTRALTTNVADKVACIEARKVIGLKSIGGWGQLTLDLRKLPGFALPFALNGGYGIENILNEYRSVAAGGMVQNSCVFGNVFYYMNQYMSFAFEVSMMESCYKGNSTAKSIWGVKDTGGKSPNNWSYHFAAQMSF